MKNRYMILSAGVLLVAGMVFAQAGGLKSLGFIAPQVAGKGNIYDPKPGEIVYDSTDDGFWGRDKASNWVPLGGASTDLPSGTIVPFAGSAAPSGYLVADGSAVSRTTYSILFAVIGVSYGAGDGSTTFNLPNLQGVFLRGAGSQVIGSGTHTGVLAATQEDHFQGHAHPQNGGSIYAGYPGSGSQSNIGAGSGWWASTTNTSGASLSDGSSGTPRVTDQTYPANVSVTYLIKI